MSFEEVNYNFDADFNYSQGSAPPGILAKSHYVTPQEYGAKGDNVDDTVAFQRALDAAAEAKTSVLLPPGRYKLKSAVTVPAGVSIYGVNKANCIVSSSGINLSQDNTLENFSMYTIAGTDDLLHISSDRMTSTIANISVKNMFVLGTWPRTAHAPNLCTIECRRPGSGFYGVDFENITSDRYFNYGFYFKQYYDEDRWGSWITKFRFANVFISNPRWAIKGEVFVAEGVELSDGHQFNLAFSCRGVGGQYAENHTIGFVDAEYLKATFDGCGLSDNKGYNIVLRNETSEICLLKDAYNVKGYSTVYIAQRKTERHLTDAPTDLPPILLDKSLLWHKYRTLSDYSSGYPNVTIYKAGKFLSEHDSKFEAENLANTQYWPMYRCIEFDEEGAQDRPIFGFELLNSGARGAKSVQAGFVGFNAERDPVYSRRTENSPHYTLHRLLTEEYMPHGTTEKRIENANEGVMYFDTTLGRPVWSKGNGEWLDAFGDVETALDGIIALQQSLIGGDGE